ncbi:MAG: methylated-DNA--[protein]-cysteine S-methyltransferase [Bacteroidia bacterium]|nr:methylated-DNA--[protein]-cysteine S-methyltransferase [Bacteroidia bacterium]
MKPFDSTIIPSPLGMLEITGSHGVIFSVSFLDNKKAKPTAVPASLQKCATQLEEYFSFNRKTFDLTLQPNGTIFQRHVWDELLKIPYGKTSSYLKLARELGDEKSIRAAASANGKNPIAILIPCHRVIGSHGEMVGYAGGVKRKEWLLAHEKGEEQLGLF